MVVNVESSETSHPQYDQRSLDERRIEYRGLLKEEDPLVREKRDSEPAADPQGRRKTFFFCCFWLLQFFPHFQRPKG